jgi:hypothetical protein
MLVMTLVTTLPRGEFAEDSDFAEEGEFAQDGHFSQEGNVAEEGSSIATVKMDWRWNEKWICASSHSQLAWMAVETAMTGALAPKQSPWCTDVKLCDRAPGTINVEISGEFAPCPIHNWLWLAVEFAMTGAFAPKQSSQCTDVIFDCAPGAITTAPAISYLYEKAVASLAMCHCQTTTHGLKCGCHCHCVVAVAAFVRWTIWNWS